jgi:Predicted acetyltransferase involved in intracellular survival and related acetyltransferases
MEKLDICKGTPQDREDIIDFANYVFSHSYRPHDFIRFVPRLYGEGQHTEGYHYLVKENGKIKAMLCAEPRVLQVGEYSLKMNYIGTVSVHPYARNKGYMKLIMQQMLEEAEENGCVLSALGGQRNRYGYYGYEMGGMKLGFSINDKNIRHYCRDMQKLFTFTEIKEQDEAILDKVFELCNRQEIKMSRPRNEIFCMLHEWDSTPYAVMENDIFKGYLVLADNNLLEIRLECESLLPQVLYSLFAEKNLNSIQIMAADCETERLAALYDISENYRIETSDNIRIFDYSALIEAFLKMKAEKEGLLEGKINL